MDELHSIRAALGLVMSACFSAYRHRLRMLAGAGVAAFALFSSLSQATPLQRDAKRIESDWVQTASVVTHMQPRFLTAGQRVPLMIPSAWMREDGCTSVGILGTRSIEFSLVISTTLADSNKGKEVEEEFLDLHSTAGALTLTRCGASRSDLSNLFLQMKSPQGTLEVLVAQGAKACPTLETVLQERTPGEAVPIDRPGPPPFVAPYEERVRLALRSLEESGALIDDKVELGADGQGLGSRRVLLRRGCHRLLLQPETRHADGVFGVDLDMELRQVGSPGIFRDRSYATDAVVDRCVGRSELMDLRFTGAIPRFPVSFLHGFWEIPKGIPLHWEPRAQGAIAQVLRTRRGPDLVNFPVWEGLGGTGKTVIPVLVEAGSCYLFAAGVFLGDVRVIQGAARVGPRLSSDSGRVGAESVLVSFCSGQETVALLEVLVFGSGITWQGGLWRVGDVLLGGEGSP